ncbi:hypothetical protein B0H11DRAFT_1982127 [Mycena galericulata]|nr:hypothetical protein B0H11DRAFT_1982127 [Mycena galericulata]
MRHQRRQPILAALVCPAAIRRCAFLRLFILFCAFVRDARLRLALADGDADLSAVDIRFPLGMLRLEARNESLYAWGVGNGPENAHRS